MLIIALHTSDINYTNNSHAIDRQLKRDPQKWSRVGKVLSSQGAKPRVKGCFYKAILQSVLLYGSE
jgi:hypothetical protein